MKFTPEPLLTANLEQLKEWLQRQFYNVYYALRYPEAEWDDVRVALETAKPGASNPPGFAKLSDNGSGSTGVFAYHFDASSEEDVFFEIQLPHGYKEGSDIEPHIHWCPTTTGTGTVRWGLEYTYSNPEAGEVFGNTTIIYAEDTADGTSKEHKIAGFTDIVDPDMKISAVLLCRLFRDATHANDTYASDAAGVSFDLHVQLDTRGSERTYIKRTA